MPEIRSVQSIHEVVWHHVGHLWEPNAVFGHGTDHAQRAYHLASHICDMESLDFLVAGAGCLMMDAGLSIAAGRRDHIERGITIAEEVIAMIPELQSAAEVIVSAVAHHEADDDIPADLPGEVLCVRDCDTLDRMGVSGIAMTLTYGEWIGRDLYDLTDPICSAREPRLDDFTLDYVRHLTWLEGRLSLTTSKTLGLAKHTEIDRFLSAFERAVTESTTKLDYKEARVLLDECSNLCV